MVNQVLSEGGYESNDPVHRVTCLMKDGITSFLNGGSLFSGSVGSLHEDFGIELPEEFSLEILHDEVLRIYILSQLRFYRSFYEADRNIELLQKLHRTWVIAYEDMEAILMEQMEMSSGIFSEAPERPSDFQRGLANSVLKKLQIILEEDGNQFSLVL